MPEFDTGGSFGVFLAKDPGAEDELAKEGKLAFDFGQLWMKGQRIATGQANVKAYVSCILEV